VPVAPPATPAGCGSGHTAWRRLRNPTDRGKHGSHYHLLCDANGLPLTRRVIKVRIARRAIEDRTKLGRVRWVVERTISWLLRFKRLGRRHDRTGRTLAPLLTLAMVLINLRRLIQQEIWDQVSLRPRTHCCSQSRRAALAHRAFW